MMMAGWSEAGPDVLEPGWSVMDAGTSGAGEEVAGCTTDACWADEGSDCPGRLDDHQRQPAKQPVVEVEGALAWAVIGEGVEGLREVEGLQSRHIFLSSLLSSHVS